MPDLYVIAEGEGSAALQKEVNQLVDLGYYPQPVPITTVTFLRWSKTSRDEKEAFTMFYQPMWKHDVK